MNQIVLVLLILASAAQLQKEKDAQSNDSTQWQRVFADYAHQLKIHAGSDSTKTLPLVKSVLRYSEPTRHVLDGTVFLWVQDDRRPAVIGSVFVWRKPTDEYGMSHKFHSLVGGPITVTAATPQLVERWRPSRAGIQWRPVPSAPRPAKRAQLLSLQARQLARRHWVYSVESRLGRHELRLMPQPLYAYAVDGSEISCGGAVFAFCQGTSPFVVLCLEARRTESGWPWHHALARFSYYQLHVRLDGDDQDIWAVPQSLSRNRDMKHPYDADVLRWRGQEGKLPL